MTNSCLPCLQAKKKTNSSAAIPRAEWEERLKEYNTGAQLKLKIKTPVFSKKHHKAGKKGQVGIHLETLPTSELTYWPTYRGKGREGLHSCTLPAGAA
eukprot:1156170-Pelagomonas_calceolata.AAC.11